MRTRDGHVVRDAADWFVRDWDGFTALVKEGAAAAPAGAKRATGAA